MRTTMLTSPATGCSMLITQKTEGRGIKARKGFRLRVYDFDKVVHDEFFYGGLYSYSGVVDVAHQRWSQYSKNPPMTIRDGSIKLLVAVYSDKTKTVSERSDELKGTEVDLTKRKQQ